MIKRKLLVILYIIVYLYNLRLDIFSNYIKIVLL